MCVCALCCVKMSVVVVQILSLTLSAIWIQFLSFYKPLCSAVWGHSGDIPAHVSRAHMRRRRVPTEHVPQSP